MTFCWKLLACGVVAFCVTGCGTLIPKKVEIGQEKVERFPSLRDSERETQRQAAQRAKEKADEVRIAAVRSMAPDVILAPAQEAAEATDAVAVVLGPPKARSEQPTATLADKARATVARQSERIEDFRKDNDQNAGKKIEGTGFLQVSYFAWVGGALVLLFLGYLAIRVLAVVGSAMNPAVGVGFNVASIGARGAARALSQIIRGGQQFKKLVEEKFEDPAVREKILQAFKTAHDKAQDEDVQAAIKHLTKE